MDTLVLAANVVLPMIIFIGVGYLFRVKGLMDDDLVNGLNRIVFNLFLPLQLFFDIANTNPDNNYDYTYLLWGGIGVLICFFVLLFVVPRVEKDITRVAVIIQGIFRSNFVIFAIMVTARIYGPENVGATALLIAVIAPLFNILAGIILNVYSEDEHSKSTIIKGIVTNPLIVSSVLGTLIFLLDIKLPEMVQSIGGDFAAAALPLALLSLGAFCRFDNARANIKTLSWVVIARLVALPLVMISISILLGFRNEELVALTMLFAAPTSVSSYIMTTASRVDTRLSGEIVIFTTIFSVPTIFLWVLFLKGFSLI